MTSEILSETAGVVYDVLGADLDDFIIERAVVGLFFIGVKLSSGHTGACATPIKEIPGAVCCPSSAKAMPFPGKLSGRKASGFLDEAVGATGVRRALGIAVLNALAQAAAERRRGTDIRLSRGVDAFDAAEVQLHEKTVVVGAFVPFMRSLRKLGADHIVLEKDPATLKPHELPYFRDASRAAEFVPEADVLLITGTTLINGTLDALLALAKPAARVVVVGPTVTMIGDAFFRRGCNILGGIEITQPDAFLDVIAEGGSGYHFFGRSVEKIVLQPKASAMLHPQGATDPTASAYAQLQSLPASVG